MKTLRNLLVYLLFVLAAGSILPSAVHADDPSFDYFYDNLEPYGQWLDIPGYGYCWQPNGVDESWQPYLDGYWVYTDAGWTWVSYEDFGWITYHYGRWTRVEDVGWVWVPDYQWAPAWVSWRSGGDYVGWAPLPPECRFDSGIGISFWVDSMYGVGPGFYRFCRMRDFGAPSLRSVMIDPAQNAAIIITTTNITNITTNNNIVYNGGPSYRKLSRLSERPIQRLQLVQQTDPSTFQGAGHERKGAFAQARGNQLFVPAPAIAAPSQPFKPQKVARTINQPRVDKGWAHVTDPQQKQQIQSKFLAQTKGATPNQAHAKPVSAQALEVIPKNNAPVAPLVANPANQQQPVPTPKVHQGRNLQPFIAGPPTTPVQGGQTRQTPPAPAPQNSGVAQQPGAPTPTPKGHHGQNPTALQSGQPTAPITGRSLQAHPQQSPALQPPNNAAAAAAAHQQQIQQQQAAAQQKAAAATAAAKGGKPTPTPTPAH
jgi:hypothetical protein